MHPYIDGVPRMFAVMDDQPRATYSSRPSHENRYNIFILDMPPGIFSWPQPIRFDLREYNVRPADFAPDGTLPMEYVTPSWRSGRLKLRMWPTTRWNSDWMYMWETGQIIYNRTTDTWIPVIDVEDRTRGIWNTPFKHTVRADTPAMYELRVIAQLELREEMLKAAVYLPDPGRPVPQWRPPPPRPTPSAPPPPVLNETTRIPDPPALRQPTPDPVPPRPANTPPVPKRVAVLLKNDAVAKGESCPISLTPFEECEAMAVTPCYHLFEAAALECWLRTRTMCPVCKQHVAGAGAITLC
jgi:hypothetical protein